MKRLAVALALMATACLGGGERAPQVVDDFFTALQDGDLKEAYELTTLPTYQPAPGFALSLAHFEGFYEAHPLQSYKVVTVFRQEIRETMGSRGRPFYTVDVDLEYGFGTSRQSVYVEGNVLQKLELEPAAILFDASGGFPRTVQVDGVRTKVSAGNGNVALTVLAGEHEITIGPDVVRVATSPLAVVDGPARIEPGPPEVVKITP